MKVLWLCNVPLQSIANALHWPVSVSGGWMEGLYSQMVQIPDIELMICFPIHGLNQVSKYQVRNTACYGFPQHNPRSIKLEHNHQEYFCKIVRACDPDVIHIWGTEYPHTLAMVKACASLAMLGKVVINIQGLSSLCSRYYNANLPDRIINRYTFRDLLRYDNIRRQKHKFAVRGKYESEALQIVPHVIGRTDWDKAYTKTQNPNVQYHFCNENLRDAFYEHQWTLSGCERFSIFLSQANYPIKGLHYLLEAMPFILKKYTQARIYIAGNNITKYESFLDRISISSYGKHLRDLINRNNLRDHVTFVGPLDKEQMCARYLNSHVFVSPSSIENSSNSVAEAMILGVPTVSSAVGGINNLLRHGIDGLVYQSDAPFMLAYDICEIFGDDELARYYSQNAREHARITHDRVINTQKLVDIYRHMISSNQSDEGRDHGK